MGVAMEKYGVFGWIVVSLGAFGATVKVMPRLFEIWLKHTGLLRRDLMARIAKLELDIINERQACDHKLSRMGERLDAVTKVLAGLAVESQTSIPLATALKTAFPIMPELQDLLDKLK